MGAAWTLVRCSRSGSMECMDTVVIGMDNINDNNYLGHRTDYCCVVVCVCVAYSTQIVDSSRTFHR
jgi:hypothetical protein